MSEHEHTFRLSRVELECDCGLRQVHETVHGSEMWHQPRSDYAADRSVWESVERLQRERDEAREVCIRLLNENLVPTADHPWLVAAAEAGQVPAAVAVILMSGSGQEEEEEQP